MYGTAFSGACLIVCVISLGMVSTERVDKMSSSTSKYEMDMCEGPLTGKIILYAVPLMGACAFCVLWINTVFQMHHTLEVLYLSYPISWFATFAVHILCYVIVKGRIGKTYDI